MLYCSVQYSCLSPGNLCSGLAIKVVTQKLMVLRAQSLGDQLVVAATCNQSPIVEKKKKNSM